MKETHNLLLTLAHNVRLSAELLRDTISNGCSGCVGEISDLNRHTLFELSEFERRFLVGTGDEREHTVLLAAHALVPCVTRAFSASMLIPLISGISSLPPLSEVATSNAQLASGLEAILLTHTASSPLPYSLRQCANKSRGAQALLLTNYCSTDGGSRLLPLVLSLESHRNALETAIGALLATKGTAFAEQS